jgi:hypothetical protein
MPLRAWPWPKLEDLEMRKPGLLRIGQATRGLEFSAEIIERH